MVTWIVAVGLAVAAPNLRDERKPTDPPTGEWYQRQVDGDDARLIETDLPTFWRFSSNSVRLYGSGVPAVTSPSAYHRRGGTLELDLADGRLKCIWKVDGERLTICRGKDGEPRPTDFTAPPGSGHLLITLRRVSK